MDKMKDTEKKRIRWVAYITTPDGRKIWARERGIRAFPIMTREDNID